MENTRIKKVGPRVIRGLLNKNLMNEIKEMRRNLYGHLHSNT